MFTPEKYFLDLANGDKLKCRELLTFSKQFITGELESRYYQIYGLGNSGKTTFIKLLASLAEMNKLKTGSLKLDFSWRFVETIIDMFACDYIVLEDCSLSEDLLSAMGQLLRENKKVKLIFIDNILSDDVASVAGVTIIQLNAHFSFNGESIQYTNLDNETKTKFLDFVMH